MKRIILILFLVIGLLFSSFWFSQGRFSDQLTGATDSLQWVLDWWWQFSERADWVQQFLFYIGSNIIIPIIILVWIIIAIVGFYKMMFSKSDEEQKKWTNFLIRWVVGVVLMVSASFIVWVIVWQDWIGLESPEWDTLARQVYEQIVLPFLKIFAYLIVGVLFVMLLIQWLKMLAAWDKDEVPKNAKTILIRNTIWILIILFATQIVELIYWSGAESIDEAWQVWDIWGQILESESNILFITNIINWALWFVALAILIIIIYQSYLLVTKPDDEELAKKLKRNFAYVFIWALIIWWGYLLVNFLLIY